MTGRSKHPEAATLGVRSHSGWAAYVVLAGDPKKPEIVARDRMVLCDARIKGSKQPFHEAEPMRFPQAEKFIERCTTSSLELAREAIDAVRGKTPVRACCILTASGRPLPGLKNILASHALIHSAEGEFYRDVIAEACGLRKIAVRRVRERDMEVELQKLPIPAAAAKARIAEFGKLMGPPWTQDEKLAAFGAWLMLTLLPSRHAVS
jgi:hypothetical protein